VGRGHQAPELALGAARFVLDRADLGREPFVVVCRQPCLGVDSIALHRHFASCDVGPFTLLGEPRARSTS